MTAWQDRPYGPVLIVLASLCVPGAGFVLLGRPGRGLMYVVWVVFFGLLTWKLAGPHASPLGRLAGGLAVWTLSLVELTWVLKRRRQRDQGQ